MAGRESQANVKGRKDGRKEGRKNPSGNQRWMGARRKDSLVGCVGLLLSLLGWAVQWPGLFVCLSHFMSKVLLLLLLLLLLFWWWWMLALCQLLACVFAFSLSFPLGKRGGGLVCVHRLVAPSSSVHCQCKAAVWDRRKRRVLWRQTHKDSKGRW